MSAHTSWKDTGTDRGSGKDGQQGRVSERLRKQRNTCRQSGGTSEGGQLLTWENNIATIAWILNDWCVTMYILIIGLQSYIHTAYLSKVAFYIRTENGHCQDAMICLRPHRRKLDWPISELNRICSLH